jgi:hypothetical protein
MGKAKRPRAYEMFKARKEPFDQRWKVTARFAVETSRGRVQCVRLHAFPSGHVVYVDELTLHDKFKAEPT